LPDLLDLATGPTPRPVYRNCARQPAPLPSNTVASLQTFVVFRIRDLNTSVALNAAKFVQRSAGRRTVEWKIHENWWL